MVSSIVLVRSSSEGCLHCFTFETTPFKCDPTGKGSDERTAGAANSHRTSSMISITYRGNITSPADNEIIAMDHDQQTLRARLLAILRSNEAPSDSTELSDLVHQRQLSITTLRDAIVIAARIMLLDIERKCSRFPSDVTLQKTLDRAITLAEKIIALEEAAERGGVNQRWKTTCHACVMHSVRLRRTATTVIRAIARRSRL